MRNTFVLLLLIVIVSCNSRKIDGVYYYEESKDKHVNLFDIGGAAQMGREMACSMIGQFEFKNGKCYLNIMGVEQRIDYEIEDSVIYLGSNAINSAGIGIRIIDDNTLLYAGGVFRKRVAKNKNSVDLPNVNVKKTALTSINETYKKSNSKERFDENAVKNSANSDTIMQYALVKGVSSKDGEIYIVLDYVTLVDDYGSYKNESSKLRTFRLSEDCELLNCITNTELTIDNIVNQKNEFISTINNEHMVVCYIIDNKIISLNFGCYG